MEENKGIMVVTSITNLYTDYFLINWLKIVFTYLKRKS